MKRLYQIHWRFAIAYTLLILLSMGVAGVFLLVFLPAQFSDFTTRSVVNYVLRTIGVTAGVTIVLSVVLAFFVAKRTTRSIRAVTEGARHLASGDLEHRVDAISSDETQELAEAFNSMALSLKQMVVDLSTERNKLSAVLATMADGVAVIDGEDRVVLANPATETLLDLPSPRQEDQRLVEMVRDHDLHRLISRCRSTGELQQEEVELTPSRRYIRVIAIPLPSTDAEEVLLVLHDLTREQRVETTRREFVANVSHELRTPLASVKAAVETLEQGALNEPQAADRFLSGISRNVDRMTRIVEDLLELSRLDTGQAVIQMSSFHVRELIEETVEGYLPLAQANDVSLQVELPTDLPSVIGDEVKFQQVVSNLVENAIKFTPAGGKVTVTAEAGEKSVAMSVTDTGIGIAYEHVPHVFERFYKIDRSRKDEGSGLGLAIAKHIVQAHGGEMWVKSREGEGSTFTFSLPVDKAKVYN